MKAGKLFVITCAAFLPAAVRAASVDCSGGCRVCQLRKCYMTGYADVTGAGRPVCNFYRVDMNCNDGVNFNCQSACSVNVCAAPRGADSAPFVNDGDTSVDCQNSTTIVSNSGCPPGYFELTGCAIPASATDSKGTYNYPVCTY
ncbi:MAG: hypothetical protein LBL21_00245 [Rickettsiales bacterium]|nr:hypothetical protein [Rickettsiales bacterium]